MRALLEAASRLPRGEGDGSPGALAEGHIAYVVQIAKGMRRPPGVPLEDLVSAGFVGLMRATKTFDPTTARFTTYARHPIRMAIISYLGSSPVAAMRTPPNASIVCNRVARGEDASPAERATAEAVARARRSESLDGLRTPDGGKFELACPAADEEHEPAPIDGRMAELAAAMWVLDGPQRCVIDGRFADPPVPRRVLAAKLGVSEDRIGPIRDAAIRKLRKELGLLESKAVLPQLPPGEASPCVDCGTTGGYIPKGRGRPSRCRGRCEGCRGRHFRKNRHMSALRRRAAS